MRYSKLLRLTCILLTSTLLLVISWRNRNLEQEWKKYHILEHEGEPYRQPEHERRKENRIKEGTEALKDHVKNARMRRLPQCLIIGAKKCGTRALIKFISVHPGIAMAQSEVHFFDDKYSKGLDWYLKQMPFSSPGQITVEKSPRYFVTNAAPKRIKFMNSTIKLLLIVRDPVTRLISDYTQFAVNHPDITFRSFAFDNQNNIRRNNPAVRVGRYKMHYKNWLKEFSKKQIHLVDGEELIKNPFNEMTKVEKFLGLPPEIRPEAFYFDPEKRFYCVKKNNSKSCLGEVKGRKHPEISLNLTKELRKFYAPYNKEFYRLAEVNFNWPEN